MQRMSLSDCINITSKPQSEYVVVSDDKPSFKIAEAGGFTEQIIHNHYKCKRIVANNLGLTIISEWPLTMK
jgi:hypothetical protein